MKNDGIINFLKPAGMTSHDCVYFMRKITGIKRIGHTGTLDPMAAGVLPLCIGRATRIMDYLDPDIKTYRCEMVLGVRTDTWDIWGNVIEDDRDRFIKPDTEAVVRTFQSFTGEIFQMPPLYSAIRMGGRHLYEYAREGKEVKIEKRPVIIHRLHILNYDEANARITFDLQCSKGTYVRSICHEAGEALGCGGSMSFLLRTESGAFRLEEAVTPEELSDDWQGHMMPVDYPLARLGKAEIEGNSVVRFKNGGELKLSETKILQRPLESGGFTHIRMREGLDRAYCVYAGAMFLGVALFDEEKELFKADKVLSE